MGQIGCGDWPKYLHSDDLAKAALLNWVLGYLSRASLSESADLLENVDQASVSAWLDNYCSVHPLDTLVQGAWALEKELVVRSLQRTR
jgi:hypothetical protein